MPAFARCDLAGVAARRCRNGSRRKHLETAEEEYIQPSLSPVNLKRMAALVESLLTTLENNTSGARSNAGLNTDLFERTVTVDSPLTKSQSLERQSYLKTVGAQFFSGSTRLRRLICGKT